MTRSRLYLLSVGLFVVSFLVVFSASELLVRYVHLKDVRSEKRDHVVKTPYMPVKLKGNYQGLVWGRAFSTNRYGFRGEPDFEPKPEEGEFRILSLGDSIAFGLGIEAGDHYTKVLERNLNDLATGGRFRVINAGGQGYSPSGYYVYLKHEGLRFGPRMVLVEIELCNDITDEALLRWELDKAASGLPDRISGGRYVVGWDGNFLATYAVGLPFLEGTYTYTVLLRRLLNLLYQIRPSEPFHSRPGVTYYSLGFDRFLLHGERIESGWEKTFASLEGIQALLQNKGIQFLLMIIPARYIFEQESGAYGVFARELVDRAVRLARQKDIPYLDFRDALEAGGGARLYFDFAHLTEEGNQVVGEELSQYFLTAVANPADEPPPTAVQP